MGKEQTTSQKKIIDHIKHLKEQPPGFVYLEHKDESNQSLAKEISTQH